eukprot:TRINITY_DN705_c0_g1_i1.p1 TRINITY_DN705_c0_g1~~TRINITY_DN705_c0_g1_i1.p1  ORF type:complete len:606 (+),score=139.83 TRINITY_DN705_c0_g1_i1:189-1820(+)
MGLLLAVPVNLFKFSKTENAYQSLGKVGAAILGNKNSKQFQILLYYTNEKHELNMAIRPDFKITIQDTLYINFYDEQQQNWSLNFSTTEELTKFVAQISICLFIMGDRSKTYIQDFISPAKGQGLTVGDSALVSYTGWLETDGKLGASFDSNVNNEKKFRITIGNKKVIRGWEEGLIGMKVKGRRLLVIPPEFAYGQTGHSSIPPNSTLVFEVEIKGVKRAEGSGSGAADEQGSATPDKRNLVQRMEKLGKSPIPTAAPSSLPEEAPQQQAPPAPVSQQQAYVQPQQQTYQQQQQQQPYQQPQQAHNPQTQNFPQNYNVQGQGFPQGYPQNQNYQQTSYGGYTPQHQYPQQPSNQYGNQYGYHDNNNMQLAIPAPNYQRQYPYIDPSTQHSYQSQPQQQQQAQPAVQVQVQMPPAPTPTPAPAAAPQQTYHTTATGYGVQTGTGAQTAVESLQVYVETKQFQSEVKVSLTDVLTRLENINQKLENSSSGLVKTQRDLHMSGDALLQTVTRIVSENSTFRQDLEEKNDRINELKKKSPNSHRKE